MPTRGRTGSRRVVAGVLSSQTTWSPEEDDERVLNKLHNYSRAHDGMNTNPKYCVVINGGDASSSSSSSHPPPPQPTSIATIIPRNENSRRAFSKRFRVYIFRDFLLRTYPALLDGVGGGSKRGTADRTGRRGGERARCRGYCVTSTI